MTTDGSTKFRKRKEEKESRASNYLQVEAVFIQIVVFVLMIFLFTTKKVKENQITQNPILHGSMSLCVECRFYLSF
jgi:uncharacterized oligopeptide transporter (OPT) family protein